MSVFSEVSDVVASGLLYSKKSSENLVSCGDVVSVGASSTAREVLGVVRHIGGVTKAEPCVKFLGLELMEPKGDCDGAVFEGGETTRYFRTDPKHALFVDVRRGVAKIASDRLLQSLFQTTATLKKRTAEVQHLARERKLLCAKAADLQSANAAMRAKLLEANYFISDLRANVAVLQKQVSAYRSSVGSPVPFQLPLAMTPSAPMFPVPLKLAKAHSVPRPHFHGSFVRKVKPRRTASSGPMPMLTRVPSFQPLATSRSGSHDSYLRFERRTPIELALISSTVRMSPSSSSVPPPMFVAPRKIGLDTVMIGTKPKLAREDSYQSEEESSDCYSGEDDSQPEEGSDDDTESQLSDSYGASDAKMRALIDAKLEEKLYGKRRSVGALSDLREDDTLHILDAYDGDSEASDAEDMDLLSPSAKQTTETLAPGASCGMSLAPIIISCQT